jgi:phytoene synthase
MIATKSSYALKLSAQYCQEITKQEAKNFYYGFIALPKERRTAIYAMYSLARWLDDVVDSGMYVNPKQVLNNFRDQLHQALSGYSSNAMLSFIAEISKKFSITEQELMMLIQGVQMDLEPHHYTTWSELKDYCYHVASVVGRISVKIFGYSNPDALYAADDLGIALQLTNILRDIREDVQLGRIYLPKDELEMFSLDPMYFKNPSIPSTQWENFVQFQISRAKGYFKNGEKVVQYIPKTSKVCVLTMSGIYKTILERIEQDPYLPFKHRVSLPALGKIGKLVQAWIQSVWQ